jgi:hypothetical protein
MQSDKVAIGGSKIRQNFTPSIATLPMLAHAALMVSNISWPFCGRVRSGARSKAGGTNSSSAKRNLPRPTGHDSTAVSASVTERIMTSESMLERNSVVIGVTCCCSSFEAIQGSTAIARAKAITTLSPGELHQFDFRLPSEDDAGEDINTIALGIPSTTTPTDAPLKRP